MNNTIIGRPNDATLPLTNNEMDRLQNALVGKRDAMLERFDNSFARLDVTINKISDTLTDIINAQRELAEAVKELKESNDNNAVAIKDLSNNNIIAIKNLAESNSVAIKDLGDKTRQYIFAAGEKYWKPIDGNKSSGEKPYKGLFISKYSQGEQALWKDEIIGRISSKCLRENRNRGNDYGFIYKHMANDGYNVESLLKVYRTIDPKADKLDMCAASDALRQSFENGMAKLYNLDIVAAKAINKVDKKNYKTYKEYKHYYCPDEIREIINHLSPSGKAAGYHFCKAKKLLTKAASNANFDDLLGRERVKLNTTRCNFWYMVSQHPDLVEILRNEVSKMEVK